LKAMARNSVEYAFVSGASLWSDAKKFIPLMQCRSDFSTMKLTTSACRQLVDGSDKAKLQWRLEEELREFERAW